MDAVPPGESALMESDVRESKPEGDCVAEGGSDCRKYVGDEGGAMKGNNMVAEWLRLSAMDAGADGSGTRTA